MCCSGDVTLIMLLVSTSFTTSARNRDATLGDEGFGIGKQAGIKFDLLCNIFVSKISINALFFLIILEQRLLEYNLEKPM